VRIPANAAGHFLDKETAETILAFRFTNGLIY